jgi:hypothetical protein
MANGSYYVINRVKTNSLFQGINTTQLHKKIDSLVYENIPGKILKKTSIVRNGYKGWDILNKTRRGDCQRYNILVTPFEVLFFKISGTGEYILHTKDADRFFNSIKLKEINNSAWSNYTPPTGGFSVQLPHEPLLWKNDFNRNGRLEYAATQEASGNSYLVLKNNIQHFDVAEEDTFELNRMEESYRHSGFIQKLLKQDITTVNGYPALKASYRHKDGSYSNATFVIRGDIYYTFVASFKNNNPDVEKFLQSVAITPFIYPAAQLRIIKMKSLT